MIDVILEPASITLSSKNRNASDLNPLELILVQTVQAEGYGREQPACHAKEFRGQKHPHWVEST